MLTKTILLKRLALTTIALGLGLGVIHAFASELDIALTWPTQHKEMVQTITDPSAMPANAVIALFAVVLTGFSLKVSRKKI